MKYCTNCGDTLNVEEHFCSNCGERVIDKIRDEVHHLREEIHETGEERFRNGANEPRAEAEVQATLNTDGETIQSTQPMPSNVIESNFAAETSTGNKSQDKQEIWGIASWVCVIIGTFIFVFDFIAIVLAAIGYSKARSQAGKNAAIFAIVWAVGWLLIDLFF